MNPITSARQRQALLSGLALLLLGCSESSRPQTNSAWGLPRDLDAFKGQVRFLRLPRSVDRLDWLPEKLEGLDASRTSIRSLEGLPASLRSLDISYTNVDDLEDLPSSLRRLNLIATRIESVDHLPPLRSLSLGGRSLKRLGRLPDTLVELTLDDLDLAPFASLPEHLESLSWSGGPMNAERLPGSLRFLSISGAGPRDLGAAPRKLESLAVTLGDDRQVELEPLPPFLVSLSLEGSYVPDLSKLHYLQRLDLSRVPIPSAEATPPSLTQLRINERQSVEGVLTPFPDSLSLLRRVTDAKVDLGSLPRNLSTLELMGCAGVEGVAPASLEILELSFCSILQLPAIPDSVRSLKLNGTPIDSLENLPKNLSILEARWTRVSEIHKLPQGLKALDLSGNEALQQIDELPAGLVSLRVGATALKRLPPLPKTLRILDISHCPISALPSLPSSLEHLVVGVGQLRKLGDVPAGLKYLEFLDLP